MEGSLIFERFRAPGRFCRNSAICYSLFLRWGLRAMRQTLNPELRKVLKRLHHPLDVILLCVRWYSAYPLSLRHVEEMVLSQ